MESEELDSGIHEMSVLVSSSTETLNTLLTNPLVRLDSDMGLVVLSILSHFKTKCQVSSFGRIIFVILEIICDKAKNQTIWEICF